MSWEVELHCPCCEQTYPTDIQPYHQTEMNVTWNYSVEITKIFHKGFMATFNGLTGRESELLLETGVIETGGTIPSQKDPYNDGNWNVGTVFAIMLTWARINPDGIWRIY
jgi:hypothetical protein